MGRLFGRNDDGALNDPDMVWQDCPGCGGKAYNEVEKTDRKGRTIKVPVKCDGCKGTGQVPGGSR